MARKKVKEVYQPSGDVRRIVSLCNGEWAYIADELGKNHHLKTSSDEFAEKCRAVDEALGGRITRELQQLGWDFVLDKMEANDLS
jgi:hypothetical protein